MKFNLADFIEKFRSGMERSDFSSGSLMEDAFSSIVSKIFIEKRFPRNEAFYEMQREWAERVLNYTRQFT